MPLDAWLRGPLQEWAWELIKPEVLAKHGVFSAEVVRRAWDEHISGRRNISQLLWNVVMFQAWMSAVAVEKES